MSLLREASREKDERAAAAPRFLHAQLHAPATRGLLTRRLLLQVHIRKPAPLPGLQRRTLKKALWRIFGSSAKDASQGGDWYLRAYLSFHATRLLVAARASQ